VAQHNKTFKMFYTLADDCCTVRGGSVLEMGICDSSDLIVQLQGTEMAGLMNNDYDA
jgi:hypothetical protein